MVDSYKTAFIKKETTYGTDATPTAALNATLMRNFKATPADVDPIQRNLDKPARGATQVVLTNRRQTFTYELELAGSGAAGTAAPWMEHLEGCGMAAAVLTASTKAEQRMLAVGSAQSSLTAYHWLDINQRRRALGCRGDISTIDFTAGAYPFVGLSMTGLLPATTPFDSTGFGGTADYSRWKDPVEVSTANTQFTLDGYAAVLRSLKLQANVDIKLRSLVGSTYIQRGNHRLTGKAMIEAPPVATKNYFTTMLAGTQVAMQVIHGTVAGNIVQLDAATVQILAINDAEEDDVAMYEIDLQLNISAGQDDILLTAK